ncbi:prolyl 4-hydroxylase subunit alpha-1-like [Trifolium medium]|uniref:Prolyl 4-hydroxylase subunit alpha-1-like n=1 Tax=Trifolium medium TaxID=97028 RepID=A0A392MBX6_9FABA|nr:prolyl 4-hydroxylase subunit alpha-1-like [Trifolium medium]
MAKGKYTRSLGKKLSTVTLIFWTLFMLTLVIIVLLALGIVYLPNTSDDSSTTTDLSGFRRKTSERKEQWTEILSWEPRAFIYHNFLSKEECEYMINLAKPFMAKSSVVDSKTGKSTESRVRTSSGMFLKRGKDKIIQNIERRIADFTFIPVDPLKNLVRNTG